MSHLCRNKQSDTTLFITQLCIVYTFTLFCRFEQKVRIAQWSTYRIFQSFLALQAWVQYSSVPLLFYSFLTIFRHFVNLHTIPIAYYYKCKCLFQDGNASSLLSYAVYVSFTFVLYTYLLQPVYVFILWRKEQDFVLFVFVIPPRCSTFFYLLQ